MYPFRPPEPRRVGEVWLTGNENRIGEGPEAAATLGEWVRRVGPTLLGESYRPHTAPREPSGFPLLVKFLFTSDKLSVQVHPDDSRAWQQEQGAGKTEMWHVVRAEPGAQLAVGFRQDLPAELALDRTALRAAAESGEIEQMLDWREVHQGETFFIPAGTVHAIGAGLVLCEIQQNSDITYRLYDYKRPGTDGRPRPLHVDQALEALVWQTPSGRTRPLEYGSGTETRLCLAACPYFATEKWRVSKPARLRTRRKFELWIGLEGEAEWEAEGNRVSCRRGEVAMIPAEVPSFTIRPASPCVLLRTFVPDLEKEVLAPLRARGYSDAELQGVCFPLRIGNAHEAR